MRHANPTFLDGYALRLLARPMTRIYTNDVVRAAVAPHVHTGSIDQTILLGHDTGWFAKRRNAGLRLPLRVATTEWKSAIGSRVAELLHDDDRFEFRALRGTVGWIPLRDLYGWADVFLAAPGPEEGFYLPGLEAMASGALVIIPDVGGNLAYCEFGVNCLRAAYEEEQSYVDALEQIVAMGNQEVQAMREAGWASGDHHDLGAESEAFANLLRRVYAEARPRSRRHAAALSDAIREGRE